MAIIILLYLHERKSFLLLDDSGLILAKLANFYNMREFFILCINFPSLSSFLKEWDRRELDTCLENSCILTLDLPEYSLLHHCHLHHFVYFFCTLISGLASAWGHLQGLFLHQLSLSLSRRKKIYRVLTKIFFLRIYSS